MRNTDLFDDYLTGRLNEEEMTEFRSRLNADPVFNNAYEEHKKLVQTLKDQEERASLKKKLMAIHAEEFGSDAKIVSFKKESRFQRYGKNVAMAAGVGLIAVLSTLALLSTGGYLLKKQGNDITDLKREVTELKYTQDNIVEAIINVAEKPKYAPANFEGTGFALNNKGYIITSWHMVKGADSIFIENGSTERNLTKVIFSDPKIDIAILKLENNSVAKNWQVPFSFNTKSSDMGERIFTLGYPRKDVVYGEGTLSSLKYNNDSSLYQVSIPVNPGNSGGPLLDEQGRIIGVIRGKITNAEATGFAIKADAIMRAINSLGTDHEDISVNTKKNLLKGIKRSEQIKRINPYVFNVMVYKTN
jgi:S1-C subfamily serine protease